MMKQPRLEQTQTRCVPEIFKIRLKLFEAGNQLNAGALSQSASSNHALLITKSALVIKKKCPLSQPTDLYFQSFHKIARVAKRRGQFCENFENTREINP